MALNGLNCAVMPLRNYSLTHPLTHSLTHSLTHAILGYRYFVQGQPEFLGRCRATPQVKLEEEAYDPAQLDWFDIYRGIAKAGQLLASFELLEASHTHDILRLLFTFCHHH